MNPQEIQIQELTQRVNHLEGLLFAILKSDRMMIEKNMQMADGRNVQLGKTTGTKFGTEGGATGQKIGFFGATPVVQQTASAPASVANIYNALHAYGLFTVV